MSFMRSKQDTDANFCGACVPRKSYSQAHVMLGLRGAYEKFILYRFDHQTI